MSHAVVNNYFLPLGYQSNAPAKGFDNQADFWNAERIATSGRYQHQVYKLARRIADARQCKSILDIGCGVGTKLMRHFGSSFSLTGVDQCAAIDRCRDLYPNQRWLVDNLNDPNLCAAGVDAPADVIICSDVIEHLPRPERLLAHLGEMAAPDTLLILSTPERDRLLGRNACRPVNPDHLREWNAGEFRSFVESSGWRVEDQQMLIPFEMRPDRMTLTWLVSRLSSALPLTTCQMLVCSRAVDS